jgi:hypothetical protein
MTGNRAHLPPHRPLPTVENTATRQLHNPRSRRDDPAPFGIGVKAKPAARVDLRSSLLTPTLIGVCPHRAGKKGQTSHNPSDPQGLTRPRSFRDDLLREISEGRPR